MASLWLEASTLASSTTQLLLPFSLAMVEQSHLLFNEMDGIEILNLKQYKWPKGYKSLGKSQKNKKISIVEERNN